MKSAATFFGHPLHAALVPLPLGAFPTALVFDVLYLWQHDPAWYRGALVASVVAAVTLLVAIIPGLVDYTLVVPRQGEVRAHATVHMVLGLALTGYVAAIALTHWLTGPQPTRFVAVSALGGTLVGTLALFAQGYVGGGLVTRHQVSIETGYLQELPPPTRKEGPSGKGGPD